MCRVQLGGQLLVAGSVGGEGEEQCGAGQLPADVIHTVEHGHHTGTVTAHQQSPPLAPSILRHETSLAARRQDKPQPART